MTPPSLVMKVINDFPALVYPRLHPAFNVVRTQFSIVYNDNLWCFKALHGNMHNTHTAKLL